jgi:hypothetical protein
MARRKFVTVIISGYLSDDIVQAHSNGTCSYASLSEHDLVVTRNGEIVAEDDEVYPGDIWITKPQNKIYINDIEWRE